MAEKAIDHDRQTSVTSLSGFGSVEAPRPVRQKSIRRDANARQILLTLLAEIEVFAELAERVVGGPDPYVVAMVKLGIPYQPDAWCDGPLRPARRKAYSRAARRLEQAGLVERIVEPGRNRVTHLRPTAPGMRWALRLAGGDADPVAVIEGLRRTVWGDELTAEVRKEMGASDRRAQRTG